MKKIIIAALAVALCASVSMGALQVYDSFSDAVQTNSADPSSVPSTWVTPALIPNPTRPYDNHSQITEGSLSYPGFAASAGNSWTTHQGSDDFTKDITGITGMNPGDTVYYSFLLKVNPSDTVSSWYMRLYNTASASSSGLPVSFGLNSNDLTQIGFSVGSRNGSYSAVASATLAKTAYSYNSSDTFLIVAGYSRGTNSTTSSMNLWVNPDPATFSTGIPPTPTLSVAGYSSGYATQERTWNRLEYNFNGSATGTAAGQTIDELRVGRTWADMDDTTTAAPEPPVAAFTVSPTNGLGVVSLTSFTFNDTSTGSVTNRIWNFGDGSTTNLTAAAVQHVYSSAGTYTVALTANGLAGTDTITKTDLITVSNPVAPTASFTSSKVTGYAPLSVTFTDTSAGTITNRSWDFGDSYTTNITGASIAHTYASAGTYTVAMTANGPAGSDTSTRTDLITVQTLPEGTFIIDSDKADNSIGLTVSNSPPTVVGFVGQSSLAVGDDVYASNKGEQCAIVVFKLPDLAGKPITAANLAVEVSIGYPGAPSYPVGLDLYGVRHATNALVTVADYASIGSPSGTLIQNNVMELPASASYPNEIRETDITGDANLIAWITAQYADGAVAGDYIFLRYATDTYVFNPFSITSGDSTSSSNQVPKLTIITATGGASYTLTGSAVGKGTVSPTNTSVASGGSASFTVTADNYYRIASLTANSSPVAGPFDNNSTSTNFLWSNVQANGALVATFTTQTAGDPAGTPYEWLASYGLTNGGATFDQAAVADTDTDGLSAWQEYIAGTDPTSPASVFRAAGTPPSVLSWSSASGRVYSVYWTTNLMNGFQCIASNIPWTQNSLTNPAPAASSFYKIDVRLE